MERLLRLTLVIICILFSGQVSAQIVDEEMQESAQTIELTKKQAKAMLKSIDNLSSEEASALKDFCMSRSKKMKRRGNAFIIAGAGLMAGGAAVAATVDGNAGVSIGSGCLVVGMYAALYGWLFLRSSGANWKTEASRIFAFEPSKGAVLHIGKTDICANIGATKDNLYRRYAFGPSVSIQF